MSSRFQLGAAPITRRAFCTVIRCPISSRATVSSCCCHNAAYRETAGGDDSRPPIRGVQVLDHEEVLDRGADLQQTSQLRSLIDVARTCLATN